MCLQFAFKLKPEIRFQCRLCEIKFHFFSLLITSSYWICFLLIPLGWICDFIANLVVSRLHVILGSLLGPYSMKIGSLIQWSEVLKLIDCSAFFGSLNWNELESFSQTLSLVHPSCPPGFTSSWGQAPLEMASPRFTILVSCCISLKAGKFFIKMALSCCSSFIQINSGVSQLICLRSLWEIQRLGYGATRA